MPNDRETSELEAALDATHSTARQFFDNCKCPSFPCKCVEEYGAAKDRIRELFRKELSVICRDCFTLVGGVEAGTHVSWVTCPKCRATQPVVTMGDVELLRYLGDYLLADNPRAQPLCRDLANRLESLSAPRERNDQRHAEFHRHHGIPCSGMMEDQYEQAALAYADGKTDIWGAPREQEEV